MQPRLHRYQRHPEHFDDRRLTDRSLKVLATIARYRLIPTSLLLALVEGDRRTTHDHLQLLFHLNLVNRFPLRFVGTSEACYNLDNPEVLNLLVERAGLDPAELDRDEVQRNRDNPQDGIRRQLFVDHELMITRFHATLELACRKSQRQVALTAWRQGPQLHNSVEVSLMTHDRERGTWYEDEGSERLPHRPDAFFTLTVGDQPMHFFYEADRKRTTELRRIRAKLRAHFHFVVKQRRHQSHYNVDRIRAVLIETLDGRWADKLRQEARHPLVCGAQPTPLFWFTTAEVFTQTKPVGEGSDQRLLPRHLRQPEVILNPIWLSSVDNTLHSLMDS